MSRSYRIWTVSKIPGPDGSGPLCSKTFSDPRLRVGFDRTIQLTVVVLGNHLAVPALNTSDAIIRLSPDIARAIRARVLGFVLPRLAFLFTTHILVQRVRIKRQLGERALERTAGLDVMRDPLSGAAATRLPGSARDQSDLFHRIRPFAIVVAATRRLALMILLLMFHLVRER